MEIEHAQPSTSGAEYQNKVLSNFRALSLGDSPYSSTATSQPIEAAKKDFARPMSPSFKSLASNDPIRPTYFSSRLSVGLQSDTEDECWLREEMAKTRATNEQHETQAKQEKIQKSKSAIFESYVKRAVDEDKEMVDGWNENLNILLTFVSRLRNSRTIGLLLRYW